MKRIYYSIIPMLLVLVSSNLLLAQETETEDPFSDYSYLWEDPKAKAKEEKRKQKEELKRQKELEKLRKQGLLPDSTEATNEIDSTNDLNLATIPADTIPADSVSDDFSIEQDTLKTEDVTNTEDIANDSTITETPVENLYSEETEEEVEPNLSTAIEERKKEDKRKEKKAREAVPIKDFRSGMTESSGGSFNGGFTFTQIGGQNYVGMVLSPEFKIWKLGVGLNVPILYGLDDKSIRTEIFEDGVGAARLIRYIRYGVQKKDPVYARVGELSGTMIGFGGLVNNYTNTTSYEKRKVGLHFDVNWKGFAGLEGLYSDFDPTSSNLLVTRPYVRPLAFSGIPIVKTFELGAVYATDKDQTEIPTTDSTFTTYSFTENGVSAFGIDAGVTVLSIPFIQIDLFSTWNKLNMTSPALTDSLQSVFDANGTETLSDGYEDGSGFSVGLNFRFNFIADLLSTDLRIERLSYSEHYLPQFFDANYELQKDARILSLGNAQKMSGIYGSLTGHILDKVRLGGSLLLPDEVSASSPAVVMVHADAERLADKVSIHANYIKGNLDDLSDAFTFDERSLAKVRFIYHMNKFLAAGVDYYWAFALAEDGSYKVTKYVSPYFGVSIQF